MNARAQALPDPRPAALDAGAVAATVLRTAGTADLDVVQAFVRGLSSRTRQLRFFASLPELPAPLAAALGSGDPAHHFVIGVAPSAGVVALGQLARTAEGRAELAVVVGDDRQGQGIGRRMVERLLEDAAAMTLCRVDAECLAVNRPMVALLRRCGFVVGVHPDDRALMRAQRQLPATARRAETAAPDRAAMHSRWEWALGRLPSMPLSGVPSGCAFRYLPLGRPGGRPGAA